MRRFTSDNAHVVFHPYNISSEARSLLINDEWSFYKLFDE